MHTSRNIYHTLSNKISSAIEDYFNLDISTGDIQLQPTKSEFKGDITMICFPLAKKFKRSPSEIAQDTGNLLKEQKIIKDFEVKGGFLNMIMISDEWYKTLDSLQPGYKSAPTGDKILVEFSSPNTNKPLHLGHIRNILLGDSISRILQKAGNNVIRTQIINDRGIAICKSMLAYNKYGVGKTPDEIGRKSDHFVGDYYVAFEKAFQKEYAQWQNSEVAESIKKEKKNPEESPDSFFKRYRNIYFNEFSDLGQEARHMLKEWEKGNEETHQLWEKMNQWVYEGFESTYKELGIQFDSNYYESQTWKRGREEVLRGLKEGVFYRKEDESIWVDLTDQGLDNKILLRSDGTALYITQDIGTAQLRYEDHHMDSMVYVVADEQDYHFQVLFEILKLLKASYADQLYHLSYGMVDLPEGKMKSREGNVVDADELIYEIRDVAQENAELHGGIHHLPENEQKDIIQKVATAALKFYLLKVHPRKRMTFNPKESVDMQGHTGPYIQNAYVRIRSILRKNNNGYSLPNPEIYLPEEREKELILMMADFPNVVNRSAKEHDPSEVANYSYMLAQKFHTYYHEYQILSAETEEAKNFRLNLCDKVADTLEESCKLLGIPMTERM